MGAPIYTVVSTADVALSAATAKSIVSVKSGAAFSLLLKQVSVSFDGVTAGAEPVLVELCYCTFAGAGTATSRTPAQGAGRVLAHGVTAFSAYTAEPTALTVLEELLIHPQAGFIYQIPLGDEYDCAFAEGWVVRCTAPAAVNARGMLRWTRA